MPQTRCGSSLRSPTQIQWLIRSASSTMTRNSSEISVVMEHADAGDLMQKIKEHQQRKQYIKEQTIWDIFIQIINALKALHDHHVVHRDLKSANILICSDGRVKLADFNVSKIIKNRMIQTQIGTPFYASPEIWNSTPYDYKADIWSLGCIIYEVASLRTYTSEIKQFIYRPFHGKDMQDICKRVLSGKFHKIPSIYSSELANIIRFMLQLQPQLRPDCGNKSSSNQLFCIAERLLQHSAIQKHIGNNSTLMFSTISENNFEMLSTIQWSYTNDKDKEEIDAPTVNIKQRKHALSDPHNLIHFQFSSIRLPPPHYTPVSNQRRRQASISEESQYHTIQQANIQYDLPKVIKNQQMQSISVEQPHQRSKRRNNHSIQSTPYSNYIEEQVIDSQHKIKPKIKLKQVNSLQYHNVENKRLINIRTESSQKKRTNIMSVQNSHVAPLMQAIRTVEDDNDDQLNTCQQRFQSRNSISQIDSDLRMPLLQKKMTPRKQNSRSINCKKQESLPKNINKSYDMPIRQLREPIIEDAEEHYVKGKNKIQIRQLIELLQGNPLQQDIKLPAYSYISRLKGSPELEEMNCIKNQLNDISKLIQKQINSSVSKKKIDAISLKLI